MYRFVFCSEERLLLQKLLLLSPHCPRLWLRLGEIAVATEDTYCSIQHQSLESTRCSSKLDQSPDINSLHTSAKGDSILCNGLGEPTSPAVNEGCTDCPILSVGDGPVLEYQIATGAIESMTCFVAAA